MPLTTHRRPLDFPEAFAHDVEYRVVVERVADLLQLVEQALEDVPLCRP